MVKPTIVYPQRSIFTQQNMLLAQKTLLFVQKLYFEPLSKKCTQVWITVLSDHPSSSVTQYILPLIYTLSGEPNWELLFFLPIIDISHGNMLAPILRDEDEVHK